MSNKDQMKNPEQKMPNNADKQSGEGGNEESMKEGGTAGGLDEGTKKGLGKTEDKIRDRLKR